MDTLPHDLAIARYVIDALHAAGIDETDPDFAAMVESECDTLDRLRQMLRAAHRTEAQSKALKEIEAENKERRSRFDSKAETLRSIVKHSMEQLGMTRLESPDFTATISATRPRVEIKDEEAVPTQLCKIIRQPDKTAIKAALEQGEIVPGAYLTEPGHTLTVRTR